MEYPRHAGTTYTVAQQLRLPSQNVQTWLFTLPTMHAMADRPAASAGEVSEVVENHELIPFYVFLVFCRLFPGFLHSSEFHR